MIVKVGYPGKERYSGGRLKEAGVLPAILGRWCIYRMEERY